jgi:ABC-type transport system involved in multi-copper enzyme maturation permease subunit
MNALLIASLVLREAARRRLLLTAAVITLALVALTGWGFHALSAAHDSHGRPIPHYALMVASSVLVIMMAFMFSVILSLGAAFLGALATGTEIENGTLLAIVPRPIRRIEIVLGKWLGNLTLIAGYAALMTGVEFFVVRLTTGYVPPHPFVAIAYLIAQSALVLTLTMTLSVRLSAIAAGFATIVLFGIAWIGGIAGTIGTALQNATVHQAALVLSLIVPTDGIWRGAAFALEPAAMVATIGSTQNSNPFVSGTPPTTAYLLWCVLWFAAVAASGIAFFRRRDI